MRGKAECTITPCGAMAKQERERERESGGI
jgi:hypothetical protein